MLSLLAICLPYLVQSVEFPVWDCSSWSENCNRRSGDDGMFDRSVLCKDAFTKQGLSSCDTAKKPKNYRVCSCALVRCVEDGFGTMSTVPTSDAVPLLIPVDAHPNAMHEEIGCLPHSSFDGFPPTSTAAREDKYCKDFVGTRSCYGGLPFFNVDVSTLTGSLVDGEKCAIFCISMGLDLSAIVDGYCRCGATPINEGIWQNSLPRLELSFNDSALLATSSQSCHAVVRRYIGDIVSGSVPAEMVNTREQDTEYLDEIVSTEEHPMDELDDENSDVPQDVTTMANERGYERKCWPYPEQCGPVGPRQDINNFIQTAPPAGVPDKFNKYVMVRYVFRSGTDAARKDAFRTAADRWRQQTCINFVEQGNPSNSNTFDVEVRATTQNTCSATLGMRLNKFRSYGYINLGWCNSARHVGSMVHEIGHNLGMNHEQKRPDAQAAYTVGSQTHGPFLKMFWQNIPAQWVPQYLPNDQSYIGSANDGAGDIHTGYAPYDFGSIMHYPAGNRFETIPASSMSLVGNRQTLSAGDIKQVMDMYNCQLKGNGNPTAAPFTTATTTALNPVPTPAPTTTTTTTRIAPDPSKFLSEFTCDFELNFCSFTAQSAWSRNSGSTPSFSTGPNTDHTTGTASGSYAFVEASNPNFQKTFMLTSPSVTLSRGGDLTFWYHMFGSGMGMLALEAKTQTSAYTQLWSKSGQQQGSAGEAWKQATVAIPQIYTQIRFRGTTTRSFRGDMAIDDIVFTYSGIVVTTTTSIVTTTFASGGQPNMIDCDFEANGCSWSETTPTGSAWKRNSGGTPSSRTGPMVDHTKGTSQGFYYYVEASAPNYPQKTFTLATPIIALASGGDLTFWYHMFGSVVGELALEVKTFASGPWTSLWSQTGSQQQAQSSAWKQATVTIPQSTIQVRFTGTTAGSWSGDMAIDDIEFIPSAVAPTTTTTKEKATTTETLPPGKQCLPTCQTASGGWWAVTGNGQVMPKCAWWSCNGCNQCATPASRCIGWCNAQSFGGWKIHLHSCAVFDGCTDCTFCGGTIANDIVGDQLDLGEGLGDEPDLDNSSESDLGQMSESSRSCQAMWLTVIVVASCLAHIINAPY